MSDKIATTVTINKEVKQAFKIECIKNSVEMSETVEQMMRDYISASQELHAIRNDNKNEGR
jgi:hypothetical protein